MKVFFYEQSRLSYLDILKGFGIILVVIGHVYSNQTISGWIYSFHMPLFFMAAGCVYKQKPVLIVLKRRFQTIVIPYFSFGMLVLIYWQLIERRFRNSDMSFISALLGLLSGQYDYLDFNVHLWFLPCFFVTVIFYNVMVSIGEKKLTWVVSALMSVAYVHVPFQGLPWGIDRVFRYIGFYAIGNILTEGGIEKKVEEYSAISKVIAGIFLLVFNFGLSYFGLYIGYMWFVTALIGVGGVFIKSVFINENIILQYLGRISIIVLCIHGPVYRVLIKLVSVALHLGTDVARTNFLIVMSVVVLTLMICTVVYEIVVRIVPWMVGKKKYF